MQLSEGIEVTKARYAGRHGNAKAQGCRVHSTGNQQDEVREASDLIGTSRDIVQVADGLQFLHHEANLVHRGLSPGVVLLTAAGAWKLAGLGLAVQGQFGASEGAQIRPFDFSNSSPPLWLQLTQVRRCCASAAWLRLCVGLPECPGHLVLKSDDREHFSVAQSQLNLKAESAI